MFTCYPCIVLIFCFCFLYVMKSSKHFFLGTSLISQPHALLFRQFGLKVWEIILVCTHYKPTKGIFILVFRYKLRRVRFSSGISYGIAVGACADDFLRQSTSRLFCWYVRFSIYQQSFRILHYCTEVSSEN